MDHGCSHALSHSIALTRPLIDHSSTQLVLRDRNSSSTMATGKRTRAAAEFLQHTSKKVKVDAPLSGDASVMPAASESLSSLHALIYPTGKKATSELTHFQRRVYAITKRIPPGQPHECIQPQKQSQPQSPPQPEGGLRRREGGLVDRIQTQ